jgi:hypothetical protein
MPTTNRSPEAPSESTHGEEQLPYGVPRLVLDYAGDEIMKELSRKLRDSELWICRHEPRDTVLERRGMIVKPNEDPIFTDTCD